MNVLFSTPAYMGTVGVGYFASMSQTLGNLHAAGITAGVAFTVGDALVGHARNGLMHRFLESDATHLFFIDADLEWDPAAPLRMLQADKSMVLGLYPLKQDAPEFAVSFETDVNGNAILKDGLLPLKHGPAGFMCLKRKMIERLVSKFPTLKYDGGYNFFQTEIKDGIFWGEDTAFCERWRSISGSLWAMPDISFKHTGNKAWGGNFWAHHMRPA